MHQDFTPPIFSPRKLSCNRAAFHRARGEHSGSDKFRELKRSVSFSSVDRRQSRQFFAWPLAHCSSFLSLHRTVVWLDVGVGAEPSRHLRRAQRCQNLPPRPSDEFSEDHRNPAPPKPPQASAWPPYAQSTLRDALCGLKTRRARSLPPANP
jgi:hypothetical protein